MEFRAPLDIVTSEHSEGVNGGFIRLRVVFAQAVGEWVKTQPERTAQLMLARLIREFGRWPIAGRYTYTATAWVTPLDLRRSAVGVDIEVSFSCGGTEVETADTHRAYTEYLPQTDIYPEMLAGQALNVLIAADRAVKSPRIAPWQRDSDDAFTYEFEHRRVGPGAPGTTIVPSAVPPRTRATLSRRLEGDWL